MSRIGKKPIAIPGAVKVSLGAGTVTIEGKAKLSMQLPPRVSVVQEGAALHVRRDDDSAESSAMQGLARSLINNMVIGVTEGFKKELAIVGVGLRATLAGNKLSLNLGFSHVIEFMVPEGIKLTLTDATKILIEGADKQLVGETAATIRRFRKPEPYKGKGVRYVNERIILKEGKSAG